MPVLPNTNLFITCCLQTILCQFKNPTKQHRCIHTHTLITVGEVKELNWICKPFLLKVGIIKKSYPNHGQILFVAQKAKVELTYAYHVNGSHVSIDYYVARISFLCFQSSVYNFSRLGHYRNTHMQKHLHLNILLRRTTTLLPNIKVSLD